MTKAALLFFGLAALVALPATAPAQDNAANSAVNEAVTEAVLRQANELVLRDKLAEASHANQAGDTAAAAKLYQESCQLVSQIGSGIDPEAKTAMEGLASTRLTLARADQARADYRDAAVQVQQILNVNPKNPEALAFKKQHDQILDRLNGQIPSRAVVDMIPQVAARNADAVAGTVGQRAVLDIEGCSVVDDGNGTVVRARVCNGRVAEASVALPDNDAEPISWARGRIQ